VSTPINFLPTSAQGKNDGRRATNCHMNVEIADARSSAQVVEPRRERLFAATPATSKTGRTSSKGRGGKG
jgi:hypothetical protein